LDERSGGTTDPDSTLVAEAVETAAKRLHPGLAEDTELQRSLTEHVERLRIRVRYGLPVHNPLLKEVTLRYPDVHDVAGEIAQRIGDELEGQMSDVETGFVTMYLSGALERLRLKPRKRAIVVCPSGVATVWILVSRIQAEFPELDIVEVVSAGSFVRDDHESYDIVISTIDIGAEESAIPVVVVNPLLPTDDVRRLARSL
ncbi:MAG: PRD domain-containing protein, partial [Acidimicrobiia bacterium]|nr:PRD domain-containing protein [Acidimicrobiia bacterium]